MKLQTAKRIAPFFYYIPTIIVVGLRLIIPHYAFLMLIIPYYIIALYTIKKTPQDERNKVEYLKLVFLTVIHFTLYGLLFWK